MTFTVTSGTSQFTVEDPTVDLVVEDELVVLTATEQSAALTVTEDRVVFDVAEPEVVLGATGAVLYLEEDKVPYDKEIDEPVPGTLYVGEASPGTATSEAKWRIKRVTSNPTGLSTDWAGGTAAFDKVWDDRTSLSYGP